MGMKQNVMNLKHLTLAQVEERWNNDWISDQEWEAYCRVWDWSGPRFSGSVGIRHEAYWKAHGQKAYYDKIAKVRRAFEL